MEVALNSGKDMCINLARDWEKGNTPVVRTVMSAAMPCKMEE